jgi:ubiquinone/menaquinone biosynthesis methyltransferase
MDGSRHGEAAATAGTHDTRERVEAIDAHGRRVQAMFSDIAPGYDRANRLMSLGIDVRWRRRAVERLFSDHPSAGEDARVLDLCAGTLDSTLEIHRRWPRARITAGDFSEGMLRAGERRLRGTARAMVTTKQMDAHALPLPAASLDAAFCAFGLRNVSDLPRALSELARCMRGGGRLVILEFFRPERMAARAFHRMYNNTVLPAVGWACTGNLDAYRYLPQSISAFDRVEDFAEALRNAGFEAVATESLTLGVASIVHAQRKTDPAPGPRGAA